MTQPNLCTSKPPLALLNNFGYQILLKTIDDNLLNIIKQDLTVKIIDQTYNSSDSFNIYCLLHDRIIVPQHYGFYKFGQLDYKNPHLVNFQTSQLIFQKQLRHDQVKIIDKLLHLYSHGQLGVLVSLPTGFGKTILSIYILSQIVRGKTLILVHKDILLQQWFQQITDSVNNVKINLIKGSNNYSPLQYNQELFDHKKYFYDSDIDICMLQTVSKHSYQIDKQYAKQYKLLIVDESHHISSKVFSNSLLKFNTPYKLFLSATPKRRDGLDYVSRMFIGNSKISIHCQKQQQLPIVLIHKYSNPSFQDIFIGNDKYQSNKLNLSKMITLITLDLPRTQFIIHLIQNLLIDSPGRKILILSERIQHTVTIFNSLSSLLLDSQLQLITSRNSNQNKFGDIIISTFQLVQEGFDCPFLNTLVMASPKTSVTQAVGRIMRKTHDIQPLVIDIFDDYSIYTKYMSKRKTIYKKLKLNIQHSCDNNSHTYDTNHDNHNFNNFNHDNYNYTYTDNDNDTNTHINSDTDNSDTNSFSSS